MKDLTVTQLPLPMMDAPGITETAQVGGGGMQGAMRTNRETARWRPSLKSGDAIINRVKAEADARGKDMVHNDAHTIGAVALHRDTIVGAQYRLNAAPNLRVLGAANKAFDQNWAEEFQTLVEARFNLIGESDACWLDVQRTKTFTALIRLAVAGYVYTGEILASCEWLNREPSRPLKTAIQLISPSRLSNPNDSLDTMNLRRGIERNAFGRPLAYWIRQQHPGDMYSDNRGLYTWNRVAAEKPWGRKMILHAYEPLEPDQSRGVADMVAALQDMRMTKNFKAVTLQRAIIDASYAATVESELPPEVIAAMMGGSTGAENYMNAIGAFMNALGEYVSGTDSINIDGVMVPHLFPGTKLNAQALGTPGGLGSDFESSLERNIAAALGLSYEEFSRDFSGVSYSGARASMGLTAKHMKAKKKVSADRLAGGIYSLSLEEEIANGNVPLPRGVKRDFFYEPLMKEALCQAGWIGAGAGQIDELKETQAAILRVKAGFTTYEQECARLGNDFREVFEERAREEGLITKLGLTFSLDASKAAGNDQTSQDQTDGADAPPAKPAAKRGAAK
jgi:lambda family phage portal protein